LLLLCAPRGKVTVDPFKVLGLEKSVSKDEVKKKFRELAKQHHPDSGVNADAAKMEAVNTAYNSLMKDGMYERLHTTAPAPGAARSSPFEQTDMWSRIQAEKEKLASLDPATERATPEGKFMYKCRSSGDWVTLSRPLAKPDAPRYNSYRQFKRETDLFNDIKSKQAEDHGKAADKTFYDRQAGRVKDSMPFDAPILVLLALVMYCVAMYFAWHRQLAKKVNIHSKNNYYEEIREHRDKVEDVYPLFKDELDGCAGAATLLYMAAAMKADCDAPEVVATPSDLKAKPPFYFFLLYNVT
jgi:hypothetical protein